MATRTWASAFAVLTIAVSLSACGGADTAEPAPADAAHLPSLIPAPVGTQQTKGPDSISDNGIHLHFTVDGAPTDVVAAYRAALEKKGWAVTTIVSSSGNGGGGATYTGSHGDAYGVFDGGGYDNTTYVNVCAWPTKPAEPNCSR